MPCRGCTSLSSLGFPGNHFVPASASHLFLGWPIYLLTLGVHCLIFSCRLFFAHILASGLIFVLSSFQYVSVSLVFQGLGPRLASFAHSFPDLFMAIKSWGMSKRWLRWKCKKFTKLFTPSNCNYAPTLYPIITSQVILLISVCFGLPLALRSKRLTNRSTASRLAVHEEAAPPPARAERLHLFDRCP